MFFFFANIKVKKGIKREVLEEKGTLKCTGQAGEKSAHNCSPNCWMEIPQKHEPNEVDVK